MQCFYPNGQSGDGLSPCNATASVSSCCRIGDICLTNGYCFSTGLNSLVRRGCTDRTFNNTACAQSCTTGDSADVVLTPCDSYTTFCCGEDQAARNCCTTNNGTVHIPAGLPILSASTISSIATITIGTTIPSTATPTSLSSATSTAMATPSDCDSQRSVTIGLGAGLGVLLLLAIIGTGSFWYLWRKVKEQAAGEKTGLQGQITGLQGQITGLQGQIADLETRNIRLAGPFE